jgi:tol-pal system protein YbgF
MLRRVLLAACVVSFALPAQAALFGDSEAHKRIDEQAKSVQALSDQVKSLAEQLKGFHGRLGGVESTVNGGTLLNLLNQIESLNAEIARLRGELESAGHRLDNANKRSRDLYLDVDSRLRALESASAASASPGGGAPAGGTPAIPDLGLASQPPPPETPPMPAVSTGAMLTPAIAPSPAGAPKAVPGSGLPATRPGAAGDLANETAAYEAARSAYKDGRYLEASRLFQQFIASFPNSPLAAPAQYWVGDSLYNARDYAGAVLAQKRLLDVYPASPKVPDALLNIASALRDSGDSASERRALEQLISQHPTSEAAEKARKRLAAGTKR